MSETRRYVRRNRVDERLAVAVAVASGVIALFAGASPTGSRIDPLLVGVAVGAATWASASAPWWALTASSGIAAVIALAPIPALVGAVGFVGAMAVGVRQRHAATSRAVIGGITFNVLLHSQLGGFFGLSALIGLTVSAIVVVTALRRRPRRIRRRAFVTVAAGAGVAIVAAAAGTAIAMTARGDLSTGTRLVRSAIDTLNTGDYRTAADDFQRAADVFARADARLSSPLLLPARLVPGIAQNVDAGATLASEVSTGTRVIAAALRDVDPDSLVVTDGVIDLDAVAAVEAPLLRVRNALGGLRSAHDNITSAWLLGPVQDQLADLERRLDANEPRLDNAIDAVRLALQMLGRDGLRRYLVMFTTPAEARGLGGFMGNHAVVTVDDGHLAVTDFGRTGELNDAARTNRARCDGCPPEYLDLYGRFGANNGDGGTVGPAAWSNITFDPHFPYVARVAQVLYPQSGGERLDGVLVMDPFVLEALMAYTGAIDVPELDTVVEPAGAAEFILRDQYVLAGDDDSRPIRVDALDTLGNAVIEGLLTGSLPPPADLARDLGPLIGERRLLMWTTDPDEQALLQRTGLLGDIPEMPPSGGFSVAVNNAGESKIDSFLRRDVDVRIDQTADGPHLVADVTLTNTAPTSGYPPVVIGNNYDLPMGTSKLQVWFYGPAQLLGVTRDGVPVPTSAHRSAGWFAFGVSDEIPSGASVTYHLEFNLPDATESTGDPLVWTQPLSTR